MANAEKSVPKRVSVKNRIAHFMERNSFLAIAKMGPILQEVAPKLFAFKK
jgi:hypothetical protein